MRRALALLLAACHASPDDVGPYAVDGVQVAFAPAADLRADGTFLDLPWPLDTRLTPDGHPDVAAFPRPPGHVPSGQLLALVQDADRFSTMPVVLLRFDADVAAAHPDDGPRGLDGDTLLLVDVDPDSPERGRRVPLLAQALTPDPYTPPHTLALTPARGFVLRADTTYAAVVLRGFGDVDGAPLGVPEALARLAAGVDPGDDPTGVAAAMAPLWPVLPELDVDPADVAAATVFTTGDEVARTAALTDAVREAFDPVVEGLEVDPDDGADHPRFCELHGTIRLPQFQDGAPPFDAGGGRFVLDETGAPVVQRTDVVPVVITLPKGTMPADGWPVVLYAHGSDGLSTQVVDRGRTEVAGGEPRVGEGPAHVLARHGLAAASIAVLLAPERLGAERDRAYLNLQNLAAYRDTWRQAMSDTRLLLDALQAVRVDAEVVAACDGLELPPGADAHRLDLSEAPMMGQSAGGHLTTELAAIDPRVTAAVPTGSGGSWSLLMAGGSRVGGPPELFAFALGTDVTLSVLHPGLSLLQQAWEAAEPMVYAPRVARRPLPGHPARHLYVPVGADDGYFSNAIYDGMAVAYGVQLAGDVVWPELGEHLALAGGAAAPLGYPVRGNVDGRTAVVTQWAPDGLVDSHVVFAQEDGIKLQYGCFFATARRDGVPTVVAPGAEDAPCD